MLGQLSGSTTAVLPLSSFVSCPDCFSMAILLMLFCTAAFAIIKKKLSTITAKKSPKFATLGKVEELLLDVGGFYTVKFYFTTPIISGLFEI